MTAQRLVEVFDPPFARCPLCGCLALCHLPPALRASQPDGTTIVCHPAHGGCNTGFAQDDDPAACETARVQLTHDSGGRS